MASLFISFIMAITRPYTYETCEITWNVEITSSCQTNAFFQTLQTTNMNFEKYVRLTTGFQNAKYAIGFNGLQVCPSVPLNLVAVPTV